MGNYCAHGTWIILKNNTPNTLTTSVSDFKFEEWGDWADRPDHKCNKRMIKPNESMEELLRIARGVKSNKWTLTLSFADDTKVVLRIDQRYVNMKVKHWQWIEGLNHPPIIEGGDEELYKIDYEIDWPMWKIIITVRKKTEEEKEKERENDDKIAKAKELAKKKEDYINYFPEAEVLLSGNKRKGAEDIIKVKARERAERKAREKAEIQLKEDEKRESRSRANKKVKEMERNLNINELAYFMRSYPIVNCFAFLLFGYLFYFVMLFYFTIFLNVRHHSVVA